jgi:hypothetical protein
VVHMQLANGLLVLLGGALLLDVEESELMGSLDFKEFVGFLTEKGTKFLA